MIDVQITLKMRQGLINLVYTDKLDQYIVWTLNLFEQLHQIDSSEYMLRKYQSVYESHYGDEVYLTCTIAGITNERLQLMATQYNVTTDEFINWSISAFIKHSFPLITAELNS